MGEIEICKALSTKSRWSILRTLVAGPKSITEIAREVGLKPITIRHHLQPLIQTGLVEAYGEAKGMVGRPEVYYRATGKNVTVTFPRRDYMNLAILLLGGLKTSLGVEESRRLLAKLGEREGERLVETLAKEHGVVKWTPRLFRRLFIEGLLRELGAEPDVIAEGDDAVVFLERNCLFLETAQKFPEIVCDGLDLGFYEGLARALGAEAVGKRIKGMGHGDPHCEYSFEWK